MELPFVGMIVGACATVLSPIFSRMSNENLNPQKEILPLWKSTFEKSAKLIYPLVIYCIVFADIIMIVLYGEQYENSATYFRIKSSVDFFKVIVYAPLIINIGKVKYYSNVHMYGAIILIILEYLSVITIHNPYAITIISVLCQIGRIFCMLIFISKFFRIKLYQLFPINLIIKILIPSVIILLIEHYLLVNLLNISNIMILFISFGIYMIVFYILSIILKIDYKSLIKPLLSK